MWQKTQQLLFSIWIYKQHRYYNNALRYTHIYKHADFQKKCHKLILLLMKEDMLSGYIVPEIILDMFVI